MVTTFALVKQFFYWDKFFVILRIAHFVVILYKF